MKSKFTIDDFDFDQWDILCNARLHKNARVWYRCMREWCGYRGPQSRCKKQMEQLVDTWLAEHPSWVKLHASKPELLSRVWGW